MTELVSKPKPKAPAKNVGLEPLPPIALEVATEQGIDPRTHGRTEFAAFQRAWNGGVKKTRQLQRLDPEDAQIRADLKAAGLPVWNTARSEPGRVEVVTDTGIVHVITDLGTEETLARQETAFNEMREIEDSLED